MISYPFKSLFTTALLGLLPLLIVGCNKSPESGSAAVPATTVGTQIDDTVVTAGVKSALLTDPDIKSFDLKVETRKGEVQLSGFAQNQAQIDRAVALARDVKGVKSVLNNLSLKAASASLGAGVDDAVITTRVKAALLNDPAVKSVDISVATSKGQVQLSGFVNDQKQIERALEVARTVENVAGVSNEMAVKK